MSMSDKVRELEEAIAEMVALGLQDVEIYEQPERRFGRGGLHFRALLMRRQLDGQALREEWAPL